MYNIGSGSEGPLCLKWVYTPCIFHPGAAIWCRRHRGGRDGGGRSCSGGATTKQTAQQCTEHLPSVAITGKWSSSFPYNSDLNPDFLIQVRAMKVGKLQVSCKTASENCLLPCCCFSFSPSRSPLRESPATKSTAFPFSLNSEPSTPAFPGFGFDENSSQDGVRRTDWMSDSKEIKGCAFGINYNSPLHSLQVSSFAFAGSFLKEKVVIFTVAPVNACCV